MHLVQLFLRRPHVVQPRLHVRRLRSPRCVPSRYVAARVLHPRRRGMHRSVRDYALLQPLRVPFERPRLCARLGRCAPVLGPAPNSTFPDSLVRFELVYRRTPPRARAVPLLAFSPAFRLHWLAVLPLQPRRVRWPLVLAPPRPLVELQPLELSWRQPDVPLRPRLWPLLRVTVQPRPSDPQRLADSSSPSLHRGVRPGLLPPDVSLRPPQLGRDCVQLMPLVERSLQPSARSLQLVLPLLQPERPARTRFGCLHFPCLGFSRCSRILGAEILLCAFSAVVSPLLQLLRLFGPCICIFGLLFGAAGLGLSLREAVASFACFRTLRGPQRRTSLILRSGPLLRPHSVELRVQPFACVLSPDHSVQHWLC